jgi:hypothetical protein
MKTSCYQRLLDRLGLGRSPAQARPLSRVAVLDSDFQPVRILTDPDALARFAEIWEARTIASDPGALEFQFKVDIEGTRDDGRWLYDPAGFVQRLAMNVTPIYRLPGDAFNGLLGLRP